MVSGGKWPKLHPCQGLAQEDSALFCLVQILHGGWRWGGGWATSLPILGL